LQDFIKRLPNALGRLRSPREPGALSKIFREKNFRKVFGRSREPRSAHQEFLHGWFKGLKCYKIFNLVYTILKSQPSIKSLRDFIISDARFVTLDEAQKLGLHREVEETIVTAMRMRDQEMGRGD
jgi:hypothetical protein